MRKCSRRGRVEQQSTRLLRVSGNASPANYSSEPGTVSRTISESSRTRWLSSGDPTLKAFCVDRFTRFFERRDEGATIFSSFVRRLSVEDDTQVD
jgi:hypothetical protein